MFLFVKSLVPYQGSTKTNFVHAADFCAKTPASLRTIASRTQNVRSLLEKIFRCYMPDVCFAAFVFKNFFFLFLPSVNGRWSPWGEWCKCSKTCGTGIQTRKRTCSNPPPQNGGKTCKGPSEQTKSCHLKQCPG